MLFGSLSQQTSFQNVGQVLNKIFTMNMGWKAADARLLEN